MHQGDDVTVMARFVKVLGDRNRLAIIGLLAARPRTPEELAQELPSLSRAQLTRHLNLLEEDWLCREEGTFSLKLEALATLRAAVARIETQPAAPSPAEAAVISHAEPTDVTVRPFFDDQGRLRQLPSQPASRSMVLRQVAERCFALGRAYEDQEVKDLLKPLYRDFSSLQQALVADGILDSRDGRYFLNLRRSSARSHART